LFWIAFNRNKKFINLVSLDFDQLFYTVYDVEVLVFVIVTDVSGAQPSVRAHSVGRGLGVVVVADHNLYEKGHKRCYTSSRGIPPVGLSRYEPLLLSSLTCGPLTWISPTSPGPNSFAGSDVSTILARVLDIGGPTVK